MKKYIQKAVSTTLVDLPAATVQPREWYYDAMNLKKIQSYREWRRN